ncbi:hypothetical protein D623_10023484 [Myotis brandtii]|uniref:Uncharacterized protein n=1 Tax=Myotis brandtii TaxID=109478 RepID=S7QEZ7_MYOBR|nr:hypothetical protein D623_10023484 [Myotis brandtii]
MCPHCREPEAARDGPVLSLLPQAVSSAGARGELACQAPHAAGDRVFLTSPQALLTDFQRNHSTLGRLGQGLASVAPCWGRSRTPRGIDGGATEHVRRRSMLLGDGECTMLPWRVLSSSQRLENSSQD